MLAVVIGGAAVAALSFALGAWYARFVDELDQRTRPADAAFDDPME